MQAQERLSSVAAEDQRVAAPAGSIAATGASASVVGGSVVTTSDGGGALLSATGDVSLSAASDVKLAGQHGMLIVAGAASSLSAQRAVGVEASRGQLALLGGTGANIVASGGDFVTRSGLSVDVSTTADARIRAGDLLTVNNGGQQRFGALLGSASILGGAVEINSASLMSAAGADSLLAGGNAVVLRGLQSAATALAGELLISAVTADQIAVHTASAGHTSVHADEAMTVAVQHSLSATSTGASVTIGGDLWTQLVVDDGPLRLAPDGSASSGVSVSGGTGVSAESTEHDVTLVSAADSVSQASSIAIAGRSAFSNTQGSVLASADRGSISFVGSSGVLVQSAENEMVVDARRQAALASGRAALMVGSAGVSAVALAGDMLVGSSSSPSSIQGSSARSVWAARNNLAVTSRGSIAWRSEYSGELRSSAALSVDAGCTASSCTGSVQVTSGVSIDGSAQTATFVGSDDTRVASLSSGVLLSAGGSVVSRGSAWSVASTTSTAFVADSSMVLSGGLTNMRGMTSASISSTGGDATISAAGMVAVSSDCGGIHVGQTALGAELSVSADAGVAFLAGRAMSLRSSDVISLSSTSQVGLSGAAGLAVIAANTAAIEASTHVDIESPNNIALGAGGLALLQSTYDVTMSSPAADLRVASHSSTAVLGREVVADVDGHVQLACQAGDLVVTAGNAAHLRAGGDLQLSSTSAIDVSSQADAALMGGATRLSGADGVWLTSSSAVAFSAERQCLFRGALVGLQSAGHSATAAGRLQVSSSAGMARLDAALRAGVVAPSISAVGAGAVDLVAASSATVAATTAAVDASTDAMFASGGTLALSAASAGLRSIMHDVEVAASSSVRLQSNFGTSMLSGFSGTSIAGRQVVVHSGEVLSLQAASTDSIQAAGDSGASVSASGHVTVRGPDDVRVAGKAVSVAAHGPLDVVSPTHVRLRAAADAAGLVSVTGADGVDLITPATVLVRSEGTAGVTVAGAGGVALVSPAHSVGISLGSSIQATASATASMSGQGALLSSAEADVVLAAASSTRAVSVRSTATLGTASTDSVSFAGTLTGTTALKMSGSSSNRLSLGIEQGPSSNHMIWLPDESGTILTSSSDYNVAAVSVQGFDSSNGVIEIAGSRVARAPRASGAGTSLILSGQSSVGSRGGDVRIAGGAGHGTGPYGGAVLRSSSGQRILAASGDAVGMGDGSDFTIQRQVGSQAGSSTKFSAQNAASAGGILSVKAGSAGGFTRIVAAAGNVEVGSVVAVSAAVSSSSINAGSATITAGDMEAADGHADAVNSPAVVASAALSLTTVANAASLFLGGSSSFLMSRAGPAAAAGAMLTVQAGSGVGASTDGEDLRLAAGFGIQHGQLALSVGASSVATVGNDEVTLHQPVSVSGMVTASQGVETTGTATLLSSVDASASVSLQAADLSDSLAVRSLQAASGIARIGSDGRLVLRRLTHTDTSVAAASFTIRGQSSSSAGGGDLRLRSANLGSVNFRNGARGASFSSAGTILQGQLLLGTDAGTSVAIGGATVQGAASDVRLAGQSAGASGGIGGTLDLSGGVGSAQAVPGGSVVVNAGTDPSGAAPAEVHIGTASGNVRIGEAAAPAVDMGGNVQFSDAVFAKGSVSLGADGSKQISVLGTVQGMNPMRFTGGTAATTALAVEDPTSDNEIIFPDESGAVLTTASSAAFGELVLHGELSLQGSVSLGDSASDVLNIVGSLAGASPLQFEGPNTDGNDMTLVVAEPTTGRILTLPDESGDMLTSSSATSSLTAVGALSAGSLANGFGSIQVADATVSSIAVVNGKSPPMPPPPGSLARFPNALLCCRGRGGRPRANRQRRRRQH